MINNHPIIPSTELLDQWCMDPELDGWRLIATQAAQWGADQELEACCKVLEVSDRNAREFLYAARRPKPPSLKKQALDSLQKIEDNNATYLDSSIVRRALEALDD
jgi:hypothetical protein